MKIIITIQTILIITLAIGLYFTYRKVDILQSVLFGNDTEIGSSKHYRSCTITFPSADENDEAMRVKFRADDGFIKYILEKINQTN